MFFNVLGNTPFCCSSTKLVELSKPETPNIEAVKPRKIAFAILPPVVGKYQFSINISMPLFRRKKMTKALSIANDTKWKKKISITTLADSENTSYGQNTKKN